MTADKTFFHVLHCKPQKDLRAKINAQEAGWRALLFWFKEPPKQAGRAPRWRPLLPGYVFISGGSDYYAVQPRLYVNRMLEDGQGNPYRIAADHPDMKKLLDRADEKGFVESATEPLFEYGEGDMIEFLLGGTEVTAKIALMKPGKKHVVIDGPGILSGMKVPHKQVKRKVMA